MTITPPSTEWDESPFVNVRLNTSWISHLVGLIDPASKERYWDAGDKYEATQQIEYIIRALTLGNGIVYPNKKAIFRHTAATGTAGGTKVANAWTTLPISAGFFASPTPAEWSVETNKIHVPDGYYRFDCNHVFRNANNYIVWTRLVWERDIVGDVVLGQSDTIKIDSAPAINRNVQLTTFYALTDGDNVLRFEYYSTVARNSDGLGAAGNVSGIAEKYGNVVIEEVFSSEVNE